ncbi:MAG: sporulation integral membrane protein YtvI [Eubacterium sp.]|nr:sporulation integral membrane protein YtvI [Eubacterium sp.]
MKRWQILLNIILEIVVFLAGAAILLLAVPKLLGFFWPFVASSILAMLAAPLCTLLEKQIKLNKRWASAVIIILVLLLVAGLFYLIIGMIGRELIQFLTNAPGYYQSFRSMVRNLEENLIRVVSPVAPDFGEQIQKISDEIVKEAGSVANTIAPRTVDMLGSAATNLTNGLIGAVVMLISAYIFIADREKLSGRILALLPEDMSSRILEIKDKLMAAMGGFFVAQFKIMGIIFVILLLGFLIMRNPYALLLALIIAFLDLLPVIGTGTVLIPWALLSLLQGSYRQGIFLIILYIICLLGRQLLQPKIIGDSVGLDTLPTLVLIYTGYKLNGMKGIILALLVGIIFVTFLKLGMFDKKIERVNRLWSRYIHYEDEL